MAKHKVKRYDGEEGSVVTEKKVDINNPGAYRMPERRKSDEEIEDSFSKETEPGSATPNIPEKSVSSEKTINYDSDKPKVVTKEELEKSGLTLREYMNRQQGLKPRGESAPAKTEPTKSKLNPEMASRATSRAASKSEPSRKDTGLFNKIRERSGNLPPEVPSKGNEQAKAKYEAYRNAPSPLDNLKKVGSGISGVFKSIRERGENPTTMASGGMTSSASKRADGIAQRGKTRGKMC